MPYTEYKVVEKPIIEWLEGLGWKYVSLDNLKREIEEPFELSTLKEALKRLNTGIIQSDEDVDKVVNQLRRLSNDISGNKESHEWVKGEKSLVLSQGNKAQTIKLIDLENLENNVFVVTNQFKFSGYDNVRFDIVLMVNGIPLVLFEAKAPTREILDYHEAIKQILRYHRDAPQFFKYLALNCATDGMNFRYDWISEDKFFEWKGKKYADPLENSIKNLFRMDFFLDFISNFIVFEKEKDKVRKKIAMYQQVMAANKVVSRVLEGEKRSGLIWHTQGSGKSLTMLLAAWKLKKAPQLDNPTILLIVDRIDLEEQLWGSFSNVDLPYTSKAESAKDLIKKLKGESREVIITTIQKFEDIAEVLSKRKNIIVFVDEAHRSQYGKLAIRMRQAFPNAFIFGFTGTPIEKGPLGRSTFKAFCPEGETYLDKYGVKQSIQDGATVRLVYQARLSEFHVRKEILDREFFDITAGLTEDEQERVLEKSATLRVVLKAKDRIERVAKDVAEHYRTHIEPNGFKAQLVGVDREACALYKEALDRHLPAAYSAVIYTSSPNDDELLRKYHMKKEEQLNIARTLFQKKEENPKILIVTDMLLTGFDAPIEQVMYLDKPMRDHKLLQAIARTNRPYPDKEAGIIVDYVGIFSNLVKALNFQEEDIEGVAYKYEVLREEFGRTISGLLKAFAEVSRDGSRQSLFSALKVLEDEAVVKEFKARLSKLKRLYETLAPDSFLFRHLDDYSWLIEVNEAYNKLYNRRGTDLSEYEEKTKQLIRDKLLISKLEKDLPSFEVNRDYLKNLEKAGYSEGEKVMEMRQALEHHIRINLELDPIYETLGHRLERMLKSRDKAQLLREMANLVKEMAEVDERAERMGISREELALLNATKKHVEGADDAELIAFVKEVGEEVKGRIFTGWQRKVKVVKEVEEAIFEKCFRKFSSSLNTDTISSLSEELMKFIMKYNP